MSGATRATHTNTDMRALQAAPGVQLVWRTYGSWNIIVAEIDVVVPFWFVTCHFSCVAPTGCVSDFDASNGITVTSEPTVQINDLAVPDMN